jgi:hypothetical protein
MDLLQFVLARFYQNVGKIVHEGIRRDEVSMSRFSFRNLHSCNSSSLIRFSRRMDNFVHTFCILAALP